MNVTRQDRQKFDRAEAAVQVRDLERVVQPTGLEHVGERLNGLFLRRDGHDVERKEAQAAL